jgi:hypothetical protein
LPIYFRLVYVVRDIHLNENVLTLRHPKVELSVSMRELPRDEVGYEAEAAICEVLCSREVRPRLEREASETGTLSINKQAVNDAYTKMAQLISDTLRIVR